MKWIILIAIAMLYIWWRRRPDPPRAVVVPPPTPSEERDAKPPVEVEFGEDKPIDGDKSKPGDPDKDPA